MMYYAIRQISTGHYMPNWGSRRGRGGFTADKPTDPKICPPRLFYHKHNASKALKAWLKGITTIERHGYRTGTMWGMDDDVSEEFVTTTMPGRDPADMEIVAMFMKAWQMTPSGCLTFELPS